MGAKFITTPYAGNTKWYYQYSFMITCISNVLNYTLTLSPNIVFQIFGIMGYHFSKRQFTFINIQALTCKLNFTFDMQLRYTEGGHFARTLSCRQKLKMLGGVGFLVRLVELLYVT